MNQAYGERDFCQMDKGGGQNFVARRSKTAPSGQNGVSANQNNSVNFYRDLDSGGKFKKSALIRGSRLVVEC